MDYKDKKVNKPWGNEYLIYNCKSSATWCLQLDQDQKTSLHCHPNKKTGFLLLDGEVEIELGFYQKTILKSPDKIMIRPGLFHATKAISKNGARILEIESPVDKDDLVRFKDQYGRENKPYEGKDHMSDLDKNDIVFKDPSINSLNKYKINNIDVCLEKHEQKKRLLEKNQNTIFAVLDGGLVSENNQFVLSPGDIVRYDTIKKLCEVFEIKKTITFISIQS